MKSYCAYCLKPTKDNNAICWRPKCRFKSWQDEQEYSKQARAEAKA